MLTEMVLMLVPKAIPLVAAQGAAYEGIVIDKNLLLRLGRCLQPTLNETIVPKPGESRLVEQSV